MSKLYSVEITTGSKRNLNVVAENQDEANAKVQASLTEGETISQVEEKGEVVV